MARYTATTLAIALGAATTLALTGAVTRAQRMTPAEVAAKFSGTWQMNMDLSPQWAPRGGGAPGGGGGARGGQQQAFAMGMTRVPAAQAPAFQGRRGGGGGGGLAGPMNETDRAGMAFISSMRGAPSSFTVKATADSVTFSDARGDRTYAIDNKTVKIMVNGAEVSTKSRWDRTTLKQEFVYGESRVLHDWEMNNEGTRINFKITFQNMASEGPPSEAKAVYDKKP